jgi:hypothetical protein
VATLPAVVAKQPGPGIEFIRISETNTRDLSSEGFVLVRNSRLQNCGVVAQALRATVDGGAWSYSPDLAL